MCVLFADNEEFEKEECEEEEEEGGGDDEEEDKVFSQNKPMH